MLALNVIFLASSPTIGWAMMCSDADGMNDDARMMFLNKHNHYRSYVAKGLAEDGLGGYAPKAARMKKMRWDCDIERNAMEWAKQCHFRHSPWNDRLGRYGYGYGENLFETGYTNVNKTEAAAWAVDDWFDELKRFGMPHNNNFTAAAFTRGIGHYSQVVWQNSYKLGCAIMWCPEMTYAVCQYSPLGNFINEMIYDVGEPCTTDAQCECKNCTCDVEAALCIPPAGPKPTPQPKAPKAKPAHCNLTNGMTDEVRQKFLDEHNRYRTLVAKGLASNGRKSTPTAARMPRLEYDCGVEQSAMTWLKQCQYQSSPWEDRWGLGENIWMSLNTTLDKVDAAEESTAFWFDALKKFTIGPKNVFTREDYNNGAGNYTQMMWQSTHKIGCGVQYCGNMTLVDCQYKWTGNYVEGLIYEVGLPCEMDYDCMCTGCTCDREAALCVIPDHGATIQTPY